MQSPIFAGRSSGSRACEDNRLIKTMCNKVVDWFKGPKEDPKVAATVAAMEDAARRAIEQAAQIDEERIRHVARRQGGGKK